MSLDIGPGPVARSLETAHTSGLAPEPTQTPGGNTLTPAVAALPAQERAGLDAMTQMVSGHLDAIRSGAAPPPNFAGALAAHDQVLAGLGLPIPDTHADVRASVGASEVEPQGVWPQEPDLMGGSAENREVAERAGPEEVRQALSVFHDVLSSDRDVSSPGEYARGADLARRLTDTVRASTPEDMRAVYDALSGPELERWSSLMSRTLPEERSELYGLLVERFDRQHLLTFAYYNTHAGSDGTNGRLLGEAVARHAPEAVAEAFVRDTATYAVLPKERRGLAERTVSLEAHAETGMAAAAALSGLRGPALDRALGTLHEWGSLDAVVQSAATTRRVPDASRPAGGEGTRPMVDADVLGRLLVAASTSQNGLGKASLVDSAARALDRIESLPSAVDRGESVRTIRSRITTMLQQDPVGILENYARRVDVDGDGKLTNYFESMVRSGQVNLLGEILADLSTGNRTASSSAMWAVQSAPDSNIPSGTRLVNAHTLGFTVGSIGRAIERTTDSVGERARLVEGLANAAAAVSTLSPDPRVGFAGIVLGEAIKAASNALTDETAVSNATLIDDLTRHFTPRFAGPDGEPVRDTVLEAYTDAIRAAMTGPATSSESDRRSGLPPTLP